MSSVSSYLNSRLMVIHLLAFWFFIYAFHTFAFLHDYKFLYYSSERVNRLNYPGRFEGDMTFIEQGGNFGLVVAYIISWFICSKRDWHWINGVIIFIVAFVLNFFGWFGWNFLHPVFQAPGNLFPATSVWNYLTTGLILLGLGCLLFFWNKIINYIDKGNPGYAPAPGKKQPKRVRAV